MFRNSFHLFIPARQLLRKHPKLRSRSFPSTWSSVHYSLVGRSFDVMQIKRQCVKWNKEECMLILFACLFCINCRTVEKISTKFCMMVQELARRGGRSFRRLKPCTGSSPSQLISLLLALYGREHVREDNGILRTNGLWEQWYHAQTWDRGNSGIVT
jgi:hypothetical protein